MNVLFLMVLNGELHAILMVPSADTWLKVEISIFNDVINVKLKIN